MKASQVSQFLQSVPPQYPFVVVQNGVELPIHGLTFSHQPQQVTLTLTFADAVPAPSAPMPKAFLVGLENLTNTLVAALHKLGAPEDVQRALVENGDVEHVHWWITEAVAEKLAGYLTGYSQWWQYEGSGMAPLAGEDAEVHVRRISEIAWSNGGYVQDHALRPLIVALAKRWPGHEGVNYETTTSEDLLRLIADAVEGDQTECSPGAYPPACCAAIGKIANICGQLSLFGHEHNAQEILNAVEVLAGQFEKIYGEPCAVLSSLPEVVVPEPEATIAELSGIGRMEPATVGPIESTPPDGPGPFAELAEVIAILDGAPVPEVGRSMATTDGTFIPAATAAEIGRDEADDIAAERAMEPIAAPAPAPKPRRKKAAPLAPAPETT